MTQFNYQHREQYTNTILQEVVKFEESSAIRSATAIIRRVVGDDILKSLKANKSNEDDIGMLLQLHDAILENELVVADYFEQLQQFSS